MSSFKRLIQVSGSIPGLTNICWLENPYNWNFNNKAVIDSYLKLNQPRSNPVLAYSSQGEVSLYQQFLSK